MTDSDIFNAANAVELDYLQDGLQLRDAVPIVRDLLRLLESRSSRWSPWKGWALRFVIAVLSKAIGDDDA